MAKGKVSLHFQSCLLVSGVLNQLFISLTEPDSLALPGSLLKVRYHYILIAVRQILIIHRVQSTNMSKIALYYLNVKGNDF